MLWKVSDSLILENPIPICYFDQVVTGRRVQLQLREEIRSVVLDPINMCNTSDASYDNIWRHNMTWLQGLKVDDIIISFSLQNTFDL